MSDLFAEAPDAGSMVCGACVHRNAPPMAPVGHCTPGGLRTADGEPCEWWFGLGQLISACARRAA